MSKYFVVLVFALAACRNWTVNTATSGIDNTETSIIQTTTGKSALTVRCSNERVEVFFVTNSRLNSQDVEIRFDKKPASKWTAEKSKDASTLFILRAREFLAEVKSSQTLLARVSPTDSQPVEISFDIAGFSKALESAGPRCRESIK